MSLMRFWATVGSPVSRSRVYTTPVFPGMPVITLRTSPARNRGLIQLMASRSGATTVSTSSRSNGWSMSQWSIQVLVIPAHLAGVGVERNRRVVVEVLEVRASQQNVGAGEVTDVPT